MLYFPLKVCVFQYTNSACIHYNMFRVCLMKFVSHHRRKIALKNDTKQDMVCKSVTEIKDHAKNFPNAPRIFFGIFSLGPQPCIFPNVITFYCVPAERIL